MECDSANTVENQTLNSHKMSLISVCHKLGLETVASMPFMQGEGFKRHSLKEMLEFTLDATDHVIVGSKNINHINELLSLINGNEW